MATICDLNVSISAMTFAEASALVRESRKRRRTPLAKPKSVTVKMENNRKIKEKRKTAIEKLTPTQASALLKFLGV